jgi:hypothetical protein
MASSGLRTERHDLYSHQTGDTLVERLHPFPLDRVRRGSRVRRHLDSVGRWLGLLGPFLGASERGPLSCSRPVDPLT